MATGSALAKASCRFLGQMYCDMDCQAFVELSLRAVGIKKDLAGSNTWYRFVNWRGTPEECKKKHGKIPVGAFLFIVENDGNEPGKYQGDGKGNASHIGIYTGMTGAEMVRIAEEDGDIDASDCNFGNGAIHSSKSRGKVCTSKFEGKAINGGWNMIGLWTDEIDYEGTGAEGGQPESGKDDDEDMMTVGTVYAEKGSTVKLRQKPSSSCGTYWDIPIGNDIAIESVVSRDGEEWVKGTARDNKGSTHKGYMKKQFVRLGDPEGIPGEELPSNDVYYCVTIPHLTAAQADSVIAQYKGAYKEEERG